MLSCLILLLLLSCFQIKDQVCGSVLCGHCILQSVQRYCTVIHVCTVCILQSVQCYCTVIHACIVCILQSVQLYCTVVHVCTVCILQSVQCYCTVLYVFYISCFILHTLVSPFMDRSLIMCIYLDYNIKQILFFKELPCLLILQPLDKRHMVHSIPLPCNHYTWIPEKQKRRWLNK